MYVMVSPEKGEWDVGLHRNRGRGSERVLFPPMALLPAKRMFVCGVGRQTLLVTPLRDPWSPYCDRRRLSAVMSLMFQRAEESGQPTTEKGGNGAAIGAMQRKHTVATLCCPRLKPLGVFVKVSGSH